MDFLKSGRTRPTVQYIRSDLQQDDGGGKEHNRSNRKHKCTSSCCLCQRVLETHVGMLQPHERLLHVHGANRGVHQHSAVRENGRLHCVFIKANLNEFLS